jgi:hypothetical protein
MDIAKGEEGIMVGCGKNMRNTIGIAYNFYCPLQTSNPYCTVDLRQTGACIEPARADDKKQ